MRLRCSGRLNRDGRSSRAFLSGGQLRLESPGCLDGRDHLLGGGAAPFHNHPGLALHAVCGCALHAGKPFQGLFHFSLAAPSGHARDREANLPRVRHAASSFPASGQTQQLLELPRIETNDGLAIDDGDRGRPKAELDELLTGSRIRPDVLGRIRDALPRKKLFLLFTAPSPRLGVQNDFLRHGHLSQSAV